MEEKKVAVAPCGGKRAEEELIETGENPPRKAGKASVGGQKPLRTGEIRGRCGFRNAEKQFRGIRGKNRLPGGQNDVPPHYGQGVLFAYRRTGAGLFRFTSPGRTSARKIIFPIKEDYDIGDIVGFKGFVFKTQTGEITVHVSELVMLSKALLPLPEKYNGLQNQDLKYRLRHLDLIMNREGEGIRFVARSRILKEIRAYLDGRGYLEVDTPVLLTLEIGADARPFQDPPQRAGHRHVYAHRKRSFISSA